ncbi:hypothetical protein Cadr_000012707 [Camelus dromedarius]|uniref:Uncharacterized protein n=1 Tax=Camelus dromedarius TaxID=9838 RepID=A0A5N4D9T1_CAMDR|nr:hypothetical protein Cadr_000012707 [Camelus dromedarius]
MSILVSVLYHLNYSFKIRKCETSNFIFCSRIVLAIQGPLRFQINLRTDFSIYGGKCCCDFNRNCAESVDHFGSYCHLSIKSSIL